MGTTWKEKLRGLVDTFNGATEEMRMKINIKGNEGWIIKKGDVQETECELGRNVGGEMFTFFRLY